MQVLDNWGIHLDEYEYKLWFNVEMTLKTHLSLKKNLALSFSYLWQDISKLRKTLLIKCWTTIAF